MKEMITSIQDCAKLRNGVLMPWLGLGTWQTPDGSEVVNSVKWAVKAGYRHIDTAAAYDNERGVGQGIRECGVPREQLFITTKVWNADHGYDSTLRAFETSRRLLGLQLVDLYLIHWPVKGKFKDTWRAIEKLYGDGLIRAIGVSNFHVHHLKELIADCQIVPLVNQVEFHPLLSQEEIRNFCKEKAIQFQAWSPLMHGHLDNPVLAEIAKKYGKSVPQVLVRWDLQHEVVTIPKSTHEERIRENTRVFDFTLSAPDMRRIDGLNRNSRFGPDPDNFDF
jgi:diketogulonate reductase-like aldo/keto reductase